MINIFLFLNLRLFLYINICILYNILDTNNHIHSKNNNIVSSPHIYMLQKNIKYIQSPNNTLRLYDFIITFIEFI